MTSIEIVAVVFGLAAVWLTVRQSIWCWPAGLVQVSLYIFVFYGAKLYSDMILHGIYVVMQIIGWYHWLHGGADRSALSVSSMGTGANIRWMLVAALGTAAWGLLMSTYTDAAFPYGDAFTTVGSLIAMWLQVRKVIESWGYWIAIDVVAIWIYYAKDLHWTAGLYLVFLGLCLVGLREWRRELSGSSTEMVPG